MLAGCKKPEFSIKAVPVRALIAPRMTEFRLARYEDNELSYTLKAGRADLMESEGQALINRPVLEIYKKGSRGRLLARAHSRRGSVRFDSKDVVLEDHVFYDVIEKRYHLQTSKLIYWAQRHEAEVPVETGYVLQTPQGRVEGSGMISREDLTK